MFTLRPATQDDVLALAHLHVEGWRASYGGLVDRDFLDSLNTKEKEKIWESRVSEGQINILLAVNETGKSCGFASFGKLKTPPPGASPIRPLYSAEIYAIYILPTYWQQGLGRQLMREAALKLKDMKHKSLCLWVLEGNKRAISFYKALGGQRCGKKQVEIGGKPLPELCFGWRDTAPLLQTASLKNG